MTTAILILLRFFLVAKSMENIFAENREQLDSSRAPAVHNPIDENWFANEVCRIFVYI